MSEKTIEEKFEECLKQNYKLQSEIEKQDQNIKEAREVIEHYKDICSCSFGCNCSTAKAYLEKWK